jgi:DNA-directed RNA polymerase specialized sigma54-like protein
MKSIKINAELKPRTEQATILTLALREALSILEMPLAELAQWLQEQIEQNPALQFEEEPGDWEKERSNKFHTLSYTETSWIVGNTGGAAANFNMDFCNPNLAERTIFLGQSVQSGDVWIGQGGTHTLDTAYTGFTIFPASGTLSGTVSVYGYNK